MKKDIIAKVINRMTKKSNSEIVEIGDAKGISEILKLLELGQLSKIVKTVFIKDMGEDSYALDLTLNEEGGSVSIYGLPSHTEICGDNPGFTISTIIPKDKLEVFQKYLKEEWDYPEQKPI